MHMQLLLNSRDWKKDKNSDADPQIYTYQIGDLDVQNSGAEVQVPSWEPDQASCSWARWTLAKNLGVPRYMYMTSLLTCNLLFESLS